jgi:hypothetical protein
VKLTVTQRLERLARWFRRPDLIVIMFLVAGCAWRTQMEANATAGAFEVRVLEGQDATQTQADVAACTAAVRDGTSVAEQGRSGAEAAAWIAPGLAPAGLGWSVATEKVRADRYVRCMTERGYATEQRPMQGGSSQK